MTSIAYQFAWNPKCPPLINKSVATLSFCKFTYDYAYVLETIESQSLVLARHYVDLMVTDIQSLLKNIYFCFADSPEITVVNPRISQFQDKMVKLECDVTANPLADVTWHKNGKLLPQSWKYQFEVTTAPQTC